MVVRGFGERFSAGKAVVQQRGFNIHDSVGMSFLILKWNECLGDVSVK